MTILLFIVLLISSSITLGILTHQSDNHRVSLVGLVTVSVMYFVGLFLYLEALGTPDFTRWEKLSKGEIISYIAEPEERVLLWYVPDGETQPHYYVLPWNKDAVEKMQRGMQERQEGQPDAKLRLEPSFNEELVIHLDPPSPMPDKNYEEE